MRVVWRLIGKKIHAFRKVAETPTRLGSECVEHRNLLQSDEYALVRTETTGTYRALGPIQAT